MTTPEEIKRNLETYQRGRELEYESCLGAGTQGTVFLFNKPVISKLVAVKFHDREIAYNRELGVYLRLRDLGIDEVCGHTIPNLMDFDDQLMAIEMEVVSPPFCLDFGGAYLDRPPDYSPEVWEDWRSMKSEAFEDDWPTVEKILAEFRSFGVFIADVNPGNIKFR